MTNNIRLVLGALCVIMGLFWPNIKEVISNIDIGPDPSPVIVIDMPDEDVLNKVSPLAELVTDEEDQIRLAIFNNVFSDRVEGYDADAQQINDVYVESARNVFGESLRGKYDGYGDGINKLLESNLGTENHAVTPKEKTGLSQDFKGLAYCLAN